MTFSDIFLSICHCLKVIYDYSIEKWDAKDVVSTIIAIVAFFVSLFSFIQTKLQKNIASNQYKISLFQLRKELYDKICVIIPDDMFVSDDTKTIKVSLKLEKALTSYRYVFDYDDPDSAIEKFIIEIRDFLRKLRRPEFSAVAKYILKRGNNTDDMSDENLASIEEIRSDIVRMNILAINVIDYVSRQLHLPSDPTINTQKQKKRKINR